MEHLKQSILKVIAYFDVFDYPVTVEEIKFFLDRPFTQTELDFTLQNLQGYNLVYRFNKFYSLRNEYALVDRRIKGNLLAEKKLRKAEKIAHFLTRFPYIKGVAISGSLSKNFAYKGSDIDFFIITAVNRLWTARMFFTVFYKMATLAGFKNWFCLNYFIDEAALEIPEKNVYTAVEIATLMPKQGIALFEEFYIKNKWVCSYLPNYTPGHKPAVTKNGPYVKRFIQWLLNGKTGDNLDDALMRFYSRRWEKLMQQKKFAMNGFQLGSYVAGKHVCKPIPHFFQEKILTRFAEKMTALNKMYYPAEQVAV
jgi:hypothetical protein